MCNETSTEALPAINDPLTGVLTPDAQTIPKASLALGAVELLKTRHKQLTAKLGAAAAPQDENATLHITAEAPYLSSSATATTSKAGAQLPGTTAVLGPMGALMIELTPPSKPITTEGINFGDIWKFALSVLPMVLLADESTEEPELRPLATFEAAVTGSTAQIVGHQLAKDVTGAAGVGIDIGCIISAGGGSILTTLVRCLPALSSGWQAFEAALLAALGPAGVDLIAQLKTCF